MLITAFSINRRYETILSISNVEHILVVSEGSVFYIRCSEF